MIQICPPIRVRILVSPGFESTWTKGCNWVGSLSYSGYQRRKYIQILKHWGLGRQMGWWTRPKYLLRWLLHSLAMNLHNYVTLLTQVMYSVTRETMATGKRSSWMLTERLMFCNHCTVEPRIMPISQLTIKWATVAQVLLLLLSPREEVSWDFT